MDLKKNKDLYVLGRKQKVGGPSSVLSHYEKVDESFIGEDAENLVNSIVSFGANALYLYAISGNNPTGPYTIYKQNSRD